MHDLVSRIRVLSYAGDACPDEQDEARNWADDQNTALRNLVAMMPAMTLADAAAQLYVALGVLEYMEDFDFPPASIAKWVTKLRRMLCSVLPVAAEAAGLEPVVLAGEDAAKPSNSPSPCHGRLYRDRKGRSMSDVLEQLRAVADGRGSAPEKTEQHPDAELLRAVATYLDLRAEAAAIPRGAHQLPAPYVGNPELKPHWNNERIKRQQPGRPEPTYEDARSHSGRNLCEGNHCCDARTILPCLRL